MTPMLEVEQFRRSASRKLWYAVGLLTVVSLASLGVALIAILKPIPVVIFDKQGAPVFFETNIKQAQRLDNTRVEYFTEEFIKRYVGVNASQLREDLTWSLNNMTPRLKQVVMQEGKEFDRRKRYLGSGIKSQLKGIEIRIAPYEPDDIAQPILLYSWGKMTLDGAGENKAPIEQAFLTQLRLRRVPVSKAAIHGLLVDYVHTNYFASEKDLKTELLRKS